MAEQPTNSINKSVVDHIETRSLDTEGTLKSIDLTLKAIARDDGLVISQASLRDLVEAERKADAEDRRRSGDARTQRRQSTESTGSQRGSYKVDDDIRSTYGTRNARRRGKSFFDDITDQFESEFKKGLFGSKDIFSEMLKGPLQGLADSLGTDINGLGKKLGESLGKLAANSFKQSSFGQQLTREWSQIGNRFTSRASSAMNSFGDALHNAGEDTTFGDVFRAARDSMRQNAERAAAGTNADSGFDLGADVWKEAVKAGMNKFTGGAAEAATEAAVETSEAAEAVTTSLTVVGDEAAVAGESMLAAGSASTELAATTGAAGAELAGLGTAATGAAVAFPWATAAIIAATIALEKLSEIFGPAIEGFKKFWGALSAAGNRFKTTNAKNIELWENRVKADIQSYTEATFDVIKESAQRALDAWDAVSGTIAATQGYTKEGVQALWSQYAKRLQEDNLSSYVSSADMMKNLESVLRQGLSGRVAEEFAYMATVLNAAVPTQDFFQYASSYASIAANVAKTGADLESALSIADRELQSFASNLLYADREIAGGFATSISNGAQLFEQAAKIALTSRTGDVSDISGVLTSVSAIVSATAPDLADSLVSAVVDAATGGNASSLTALRSMAGTGASNTAFLQALATNPQQVFSTLFNSLAQLQNMSADNYMEVAEGLSEVFGLSMDAFARVDFNYLAKAISAMNVNNTALGSNMELLKAGETTSTAEQLRMQQINQYMIDEGLAYVLDSEMGRAVQQHMWDEQLAREIEQNTFGVDLQGTALEFLEGIWNTIQNILDFLNPFSWIKKLINIEMTAAESVAMNQDIANVVKEGVVGPGNQAAWRKLLPGVETDLIRQGNLFGEGVTTYAEMLGLNSNLATARNNLRTWQNISFQNSLSSMVAGIGTIVSKAAAGIDTKSSKNDLYTRQLLESDTRYDMMSSPYHRIEQPSTSTEKEVRWLNLTGKYGESFKDEALSAQDAANMTDEQRAASAAQRGANVSAALQKSMTAYLSETSDIANNLTKSYFKIKEVKNKDLTSGQKAYLGLNDDALVSYSAKIKGKKNGQYESLNRSYLTTEDMMQAVTRSEAKQTASFEEWVEQSLGITSMQDLQEVMENYGSSIMELQAQFVELQSKEASKQQKAREMHEVAFWEDMQRFATDLFPEYLNEWKKYYILHSAYTEEISTAYKDAINTAKQEESQQVDAILKFANNLTDNNIFDNLAKAVADPTLQTNMLLAKILVVVNAIMQQNNETSIVSVPTALQSLGLGLTSTAETAISKSSKKK